MIPISAGWALQLVLIYRHGSEHVKQCILHLQTSHLNCEGQLCTLKGPDVDTKITRLEDARMQASIRRGQDPFLKNSRTWQLFNRNSETPAPETLSCGNLGDSETLDELMFLSFWGCLTRVSALKPILTIPTFPTQYMLLCLVKPRWNPHS